MSYKAGKMTPEDTIGIIEHHLHGTQLIYPVDSVIALTSDAVADTLGAFSADIVAANAITSDFDLHWADISDADTNTTYTIFLYYGAGDTKCAEIGFTRTAPFTASTTKPVLTHIIPANSRVRAKIKDNAGGSACDIRIYLHTYD